MFVATEPVAVSDEAGNTIYIRPKMGKGIEAQVSSEFGRMGGRTQIAYEFCLLTHNIVKWEGPGFTDDRGKAIPATRARIEQLDPNEPLIAKTIARIIELNARRTADPEPPGLATNGKEPIEKTINRIINPDEESEEADPTPAAELI